MRGDETAAAIRAIEAEYEVEVARGEAAEKEAFAVRYQVYCVENAYEAGEGGTERDGFDARSRHVLLRRRSTGEAIGTTRLVAAHPGCVQAGLPVGGLLGPSAFGHLPGGRWAEISRFSIAKARRGTDAPLRALARVALMRGVLELSAEMGVSHWLAVMEPALLRILRAGSIEFAPIGPPVEFHGLRQICWSSAAGLLARLAGERPETWSYLSDNGRLCPPAGADAPGEAEACVRAA